MEDRLKDPVAAQYNFLANPRTVWVSHAIYGGPHTGYMSCARINGKNSFGAYIGYRLHFFLINNGIILQHIYDHGEDFDLGRAAAEKYCSLPNK